MNFNTAQFAAIVENAKAKSVNSPRWTRAIERAALALQSGELVVTLLAHDALVTSPRGSYRVNGCCECEAARRGHAECYHRAAVRLVEMLETAPVAAPARADIIADIKAAWSRRFPGESLADELMRRFRRNQLEMLSVDFLTAIRAAIA
jgi:hypothetical protein